MGRQVKFITAIQDAMELITQGVIDLNALTYQCEDMKFQSDLLAYISKYARLNYSLASYLILKISEAIDKDKDEDDFTNLMKDFE